jgi:hypothetical protein
MNLFIPKNRDIHCEQVKKNLTLIKIGKLKLCISIQSIKIITLNFAIYSHTASSTFNLT